MSRPHPPARGGVPPFVLILGPEELLAERALASTLDALRSVDPDVETIRVEPEGYALGELEGHAAPSLFGGGKALVVHALDIAGEALAGDVVRFVEAPPGTHDGVTLVVCHRGGQRTKKVLEVMKKAGARVLDAPPVKSDRDKSDFVVHEFRRSGRKIAPAGVRALLEAVGRDLRELASACRQLMADCDGVVEEDVVARYHGGKVDATGFRVADAAVAGQAGQALRLLRHALATGLDPVPIVAVLATQLRQMVRVGSAGRASSAQLAQRLGMAPWQVDRSRRALSGWDEEGLGRAIQAVAGADFDVKGGARDPVFAVEKAVLAIVAARRDG